MEKCDIRFRLTADPALAEENDVYDNEGKVTRLTPGQTFHVKPLQVHRFGANECNVQIMEVSTPHLDDVVRLEDDYQR